MRLTHWAVTVCLGTIASATSGITSLSIGGASFPADPYVAAAYNFSYSFGVSATYSTSNSGTGQQNTFNGIFQVGASDVPINTALYGSNGSIVAIPAIAGGLVVTYNIPGLSTSTQLKFSRKVLPRIFDGTIASWNDPRLVADNPALANQSSPIIIITRSAGSGSTLNFIKSLKLMDASNGFEGSPYTNPKFKLGVSTSVLAATTDAAASIVGSFPHTITYLSQAEALLAEANSNGFCNFAMAQHLNGDYIPCNSASIQTAVVNVDSATLDKLDFSTGGLSILDVSTPGAYPIAIISNFVVRPLQLANNRPTTLATLEFIWYFISNPSFATSHTFVSLYNSTIGDKTLEYLTTLTFQGQKLYGNSVCDPLPNGTYSDPCVHGLCTDPYPFQDVSAQCVCEYGYLNDKRADCSEPLPFFIGNWVSWVILFFMVSAMVEELVIAGRLFMLRDEDSVKAMSWSSCMVIMTGFLLAAVSILMHAAAPTDSSCAGIIVVASVAAGMVFSMIFFKSLRIFIIFRYTRMARSLFLQDRTMIAAAVIVGLLDGGLALAYTKVDNVGPALQALSDSEKQLWVCSRKSTYGSTSVLLIVLLVFNALLIALCLLAGHQTRAASKKFDESKKIGSAVYACALTILIAMGISLGLPSNTEAMVNVKRIILAGAIWVICTSAPILLFGSAISGESERESSSKTSSSNVASDLKNVDMGKSVALMFSVGMKANRSLALWDTAFTIIMQDLDMVFVMKTDSHIFTRFSKCKVRPYHERASATGATYKLEFDLDKNYTTLIEFASKEKMEEFRAVHNACTVARNMKIATDGSGMTKSQRSLAEIASGLNRQNTTVQSSVRPSEVAIKPSDAPGPQPSKPAKQKKN